MAYSQERPPLQGLVDVEVAAGSEADALEAEVVGQRPPSGGNEQAVILDPVASVALGSYTYRPRTDGKVERFHQTMGREWAYGMAYRSHRYRTAALSHWLSHYNERRPHTGIGGRPPSSRIHNVRGQDT